MNPEAFYETIKKHAKKDVPEEACGLVFKESGVMIARPQQNIWEPAEHVDPRRDRRNNFRVSPLRVQRALKSKTLVGTYHSDPRPDAKFSDHDKASAEAILLPSYLYCVNEDRFDVYYPTGKRPALIGRPYLPFVHDCITLVHDFYQEQAGLDLPLLPYTSEESLLGKKTGIAEYLTHHGWRPVSQARPFDLVIMMIRCHNFPNHIGALDEDLNLIHHLRDKDSRLDPYGGYWAKATHLLMRHPSFFKDKAHD